MNGEKGIFIVISGPAGSGKGTVVSLLREMMPELGFSVSATTRAPRPGEENGVHYYYITKEEFEDKIASGEVLEYTEYCGNYYGTLKSEAERITGNGRDMILEIEVEGACNIKRMFPDSVCIMLLPPSAKSLENRLRGRGTETEEVIARRMKRAAEELKFLPSYDYLVINEDGMIEKAALRISSIITAEHLRTGRRESFADDFFKDE